VKYFRLMVEAQGPIASVKMA